MPPMFSAFTIRTFAGRLLRQIVGPVLGMTVVAYFAYHTVQGDRGLMALTHLQGEVADAELVLAKVRAERMEMERRAKLLRPDNLDPDMLEERARIVLNKSHPDELVVILPGRAAPHSAQDGAVQSGNHPLTR